MHAQKNREKLGNRVKRIRGQVDAIDRALTAEDHDCAAVLQTIAACRGAINGLMAEVMAGHMREHVLGAKGKTSAAQRQAAEELIDLINSYLK